MREEQRREEEERKLTIDDLVGKKVVVYGVFGWPVSTKFRLEGKLVKAESYAKTFKLGDELLFSSKAVNQIVTTAWGVEVYLGDDRL